MNGIYTRQLFCSRVLDLDGFRHYSFDHVSKFIQSFTKVIWLNYKQNSNSDVLRMSPVTRKPSWVNQSICTARNNSVDQLAVRLPRSCLISAFFLHVLRAGPSMTRLNYETSANALRKITVTLWTLIFIMRCLHANIISEYEIHKDTKWKWLVDEHCLAEHETSSIEQQPCRCADSSRTSLSANSFKVA